MGCKEIAENINYSTELLREVKNQLFRYFLIMVSLIVLCVGLVCYIFYDRYLDSQIEVTAAEVTQDGVGYNSYIHGMGDIINGSENQDKHIMLT